MVISKDLTGSIGIFVGFSTLQEYGVDKVFVLENENTDSSQRNIVYLVHGEKAGLVQAVAGQSNRFRNIIRKHGNYKRLRRLVLLLFAISQIPKLNLNYWQRSHICPSRCSYDRRILVNADIALLRTNQEAAA